MSSTFLRRAFSHEVPIFTSHKWYEQENPKVERTSEILIKQNKHIQKHIQNIRGGNKSIKFLVIGFSYILVMDRWSAHQHPSNL